MKALLRLSYCSVIVSARTFHRVRSRLTYANVVATLALFLALGLGTVYAAGTLSGKLIKPNSLPGNRLKANSVSGLKLQHGAVHLANLGQDVNSQIGPQCPAGLVLLDNNLCYEPNPRSEALFQEAMDRCASLGLQVPSTAQLWEIMSSFSGKQPAEWTSAEPMFSGGVLLELAEGLNVPGPGVTMNWNDVNKDKVPFRCVTTPN